VDPLSLAFQAALEGLEPMSSELEKELAIRRPHRFAELRETAIMDALAGMEASLAAERTRRTELTPTPEQIQQQRSASLKAAVVDQFEQHGMLGMTGSLEGRLPRSSWRRLTRSSRSPMTPAKANASFALNPNACKAC
jgi:hypothetical protein